MAYNPCGVNDASRVLTLEVMKNLFWRGESLLGPAVFAAKCSVITWYPTDDNWYGPAVLWTLLGDPALRVRHGRLTGVAEKPTPRSARGEFVLCPNPGRDKITARYGVSARDARLEFRDADGRLVAWYAPGGDGQVRICTSQLAPGVYFVRLVGEGQAVKFIRQR